MEESFDFSKEEFFYRTSEPIPEVSEKENLNDLIQEIKEIPDIKRLTLMRLMSYLNMCRIVMK